MTNKTDDTDNFTIGIVAPISAATLTDDVYTESHWQDVQTLVKDSIKIEMNLVSESDDAGIIISKIVSNLANLDLIICDVSSKNSNVMFELGLRLAFDKPIILIKDDLTDYSFDTSPIKHLNYPSNLNYVESVKFQKDLSNKIQAIRDGETDSYLEHFKVKKIANKLPEEEITEIQALQIEFDRLFKEISEIKKISLDKGTTLINKRPEFPRKSLLKEFISIRFPNEYKLTKSMLEETILQFNLQGFPLTLIKSRINSILSELYQENEPHLDIDVPQ